MPGGRAIMLVPHDQRVYGALDEALGHCRRYAREELAEKMERAGFRVERVLEFNRVSRPGWYVTGRVLKRTAMNWWAIKFFDRIVWFWRRADAMLPWPPTSIIGIGIKQ